MYSATLKKWKFSFTSTKIYSDVVIYYKTIVVCVKDEGVFATDQRKSRTKYSCSYFTLFRHSN